MLSAVKFSSISFVRLSIRLIFVAPVFPYKMTGVFKAEATLTRPAP